MIAHEVLGSQIRGEGGLEKTEKVFWLYGFLKKIKKFEIFDS